MPYVITSTSWKNVNSDFDQSELKDDESFVDQIPDWLIEWDQKFWEAKRLGEAEALWQSSEIVLINNQLMAIEEAEATDEETGALPGTRLHWLQYRTKVRNWKEGAENFPDSAHRPTRPE